MVTIEKVVVASGSECEATLKGSAEFPVLLRVT
jgi:hypothetical protein